MRRFGGCVCRHGSPTPAVGKLRLLSNPFSAARQRHRALRRGLNFGFAVSVRTKQIRSHQQESCSIVHTSAQNISNNAPESCAFLCSQKMWCSTLFNNLFPPRRFSPASRTAHSRSARHGACEWFLAAGRSPQLCYSGMSLAAGARSRRRGGRRAVWGRQRGRRPREDRRNARRKAMCHGGAASAVGLPLPPGAGRRAAPQQKHPSL